MNILYITDKFDYASHNFIDSFIKHYLSQEHSVDLLYFTKSNKREKKNQNFLIPYKKKIEPRIDLTRYDVVIVRNFFWALRELLKLKKKYNYKIGFQLSFPHSFRRKYEAHKMKKGIIRKEMEYKIKHLFQKHLIYQCDFFLPISKEMVHLFYPDIPIPFFVMPLGVDERFIQKPFLKKEKRVKLLYIGTIDRLREFDRVLNHLSILKNREWSLDIYSKTSPSIPGTIKHQVFYKGFLERERLRKKIANYDLGLFVLPEVDLYKVASPTKVMEYYEAGIPAVMSHIPECTELFDEKSAIFQHFHSLNFHILFSKTKEDLYQMAKNGQEVLLQKRNYRLLVKEFIHFIKEIQ